jgi:hypothetical protein
MSCRKCNRKITRDGEDWTAYDGTACSADVTYDSNGDPVIGHHEPTEPGVSPTHAKANAYRAQR